MPKAMISQPMGGIDELSTQMTRSNATQALNLQGYEVIDSYFAEEAPEGVNRGLWYLAKSLDALAQCTVLYCCRDWKNAKGCVLEHESAKAYGIEIQYEPE